MNADREPWIDRVGAIVALVVVGVYAFTVAAPYFLPSETSPDLLQLIDRNKGTVDTVTVAVVMFFMGGSRGRSKDQDSINTLVKTAQVAGAQLSDTGAIVIPPGGTATTTATDSGVVIEASPHVSSPAGEDHQRSPVDPAPPRADEAGP